MTTQDALPRWLRTLFIAINDAPWTNIKTMNALILTNGTAAFLVIAAFYQVSINQAILDAWLLFLSALLGIAAVSAGVKRATFKPSPPNTMDVEDTAATTPTPPPPPKEVPAAVVTALQSSAAVRAADPAAPIGTSVPGEGD